MRIFCNNATIQCTTWSKTEGTTAVQGIIGGSYFLDDFTWFGLDYRYMVTQKVDRLNSSLQMHTLNFSFTGMFYCA